MLTLHCTPQPTHITDILFGFGDVFGDHSAAALDAVDELHSHVDIKKYYGKGMPAHLVEVYARPSDIVLSDWQETVKSKTSGRKQHYGSSFRRVMLRRPITTLLFLDACIVLHCFLSARPDGPLYTRFPSVSSMVTTSERAEGRSKRHFRTPRAHGTSFLNC